MFEEKIPHLSREIRVEVGGGMIEKSTKRLSYSNDSPENQKNYKSIEDIFDQASLLKNQQKKEVYPQKYKGKTRRTFQCGDNPIVIVGFGTLGKLLEPADDHFGKKFSQKEKKAEHHKGSNDITYRNTHKCVGEQGKILV